MTIDKPQPLQPKRCVRAHIKEARLVLGVQCGALSIRSEQQIDWTKIDGGTPKWKHTAWRQIERKG